MVDPLRKRVLRSALGVNKRVQHDIRHDQHGHELVEVSRLGSDAQGRIRAEESAQAPSRWGAVRAHLP